MSFHGSYMRCKCKRKRKWKCKRVHTSNPNAKKERYGSAVEIFFQDWPTTTELLPIHTCRKQTQMQAQENEELFITSVQACVCICISVGVVHTCNSLHLHLRLRLLRFSLCYWLTEGGVGTNLITLLGNYIRLFKVGLPQTLHVLQIV